MSGLNHRAIDLYEQRSLVVVEHATAQLRNVIDTSLLLAPCSWKTPVLRYSAEPHLHQAFPLPLGIAHG